ncbi:MAG: helix-turn-helix transcriptional regulator [Bacteroidales bacterium]|nr:helix-turn-helix transcriptional regulator [Bacteroidales bacterium]
MDNETIKSGIIKIRTGLGYSQQRMAEELGMSRSTYVNIEKGQTQFVNENLSRIAELGDISTEELVLGYKPVSQEELSSLKQENERYASGRESIVRGYQEEISSLKERVSDLEALVRSLQDTVAAQKEMMAMYKKMRNFEA